MQHDILVVVLSLFIDESYKRDHYYLAGVLVDDKQKEKLNSDLDEFANKLQKRNQWSKPPEFHGHRLMNALDDWTSLQDHIGARIAIYQKVMHIVQNSGARVYLEGVDTKRLNARYRYPDKPHEIVLRHLLERVNEHCAKENTKCKIIADSVPHQDEYNDAIQNFKIMGTPGYKSQILLNIDGNINFVDSRRIRGVQAADICVYILRRDREELSVSKKSKRATARLVNALGSALVYERKWIP